MEHLQDSALVTAYYSLARLKACASLLRCLVESTQATWESISAEYRADIRLFWISFREGSATTVWMRSSRSLIEFGLSARKWAYRDSGARLAIRNTMNGLEVRTKLKARAPAMRGLKSGRADMLTMLILGSWCGYGGETVLFCVFSSADGSYNIKEVAV